MKRQYIQYKHIDNVDYITLNRPQKKNAMNLEMIKEIKTLIATLYHNDSYALVIQANGDDFCAGADLQWMQEQIHYSEQQNYEESLVLAEMMYTLYSYPNTVISCAQGNIFGGGLGILACSDIVIASSMCQFCFSETTLGLIPAIISPYVHQSIGSKNFKYYALTAQRFGSTDALKMNLISQISDNIEASLSTTLQSLRRNSRQAIAECKKLIHKIDEQLINSDFIFHCARTLSQLRITDDTQKRLSKFLHKTLK